MSNNATLAAHVNKTLVYGALAAITKDEVLWNHSAVDKKYCKLTEEGIEVIIGVITELLRDIDYCEHALLDERAKEITVEILKGQ